MSATSAVQELVAEGARAAVAEIAPTLAALNAKLAGLQAEVTTLRERVERRRTGEWLSLRTVRLRYGVPSRELLRRIERGELSARPKRARGGHDSFEIHRDEAERVLGAGASASRSA